MEKREKEDEGTEKSGQVDNLVFNPHDGLQLDIDMELAAAQKPYLAKPATNLQDRKRPAPETTKKKTLSMLDYKRRRGLI